MTILRIVIPALVLSLEHDLFRKPVPTFRDHALVAAEPVPGYGAGRAPFPRRIARVNRARDIRVKRPAAAPSCLGTFVGMRRNRCALLVIFGFAAGIAPANAAIHAD